MGARGACSARLINTPLLAPTYLHTGSQILASIPDASLNQKKKKKIEEERKKEGERKSRKKDMLREPIANKEEYLPSIWIVKSQIDQTNNNICSALLVWMRKDRR